MNNEVISELLSADGYIQVNKYLIKLLGLHEAILIGELLAEYKYWKSQDKLCNNKFYTTQPNIEDNTGLNAYMQRKAFNNLQEMDIIYVTKEGMPAVNYYEINFDKLVDVLNTSEKVVKNKSFKNSTTSDLKIKEQVVENLKTNNNNNKNKQKEKTISKDIVEQGSCVFEFGSSKKPIKENLYTKCISLINDFVKDKDNEELRTTLVEFLNARLQIKDKPFYTNNLKGILKKIQKWLDEGTSMENILEWINYSIEKGYTTVYEQKSKQSGYNRLNVKNKQRKDDSEELDYSMSV